MKGTELLIRMLRVGFDPTRNSVAPEYYPWEKFVEPQKLVCGTMADQSDSQT